MVRSIVDRPVCLMCDLGKFRNRSRVQLVPRAAVRSILDGRSAFFPSFEIIQQMPGSAWSIWIRTGKKAKQVALSLLQFEKPW